MALREWFGGGEAWSGDARSWSGYEIDPDWPVRDHHRSAGYFVNKIAVEAETRARMEGLTGSGKHALRGAPQVQVHVWKSQYRTFLCRYSVGEPLRLLAPAFQQLVRGRAALLTYGFDKPPEEAIQLCALAALFDDHESAKILRFLRERDGLEDLLADLCLARLQPSSNRARSLQHPSWHEGLLDVIDAALSERPGAARDRLVQYVENEWYPAHGGDDRAHWFDTHVEGTDHVGYWAFEAAAIASVFGVDDGDLQGHPYYPFDLAQYRG